MKLIQKKNVILIVFIHILVLILTGCVQKFNSKSLAPMIKPQGTIIPFDSDRWNFIGSTKIEDYLGEKSVHLGIKEQGKFIT